MVQESRNGLIGSFAHLKTEIKVLAGTVISSEAPVFQVIQAIGRIQLLSAVRLMSLFSCRLLPGGRSQQLEVPRRF